MDEHESLSHTKWDCKYHVVFIPKCRRKRLYVGFRDHLGEAFKRLATQKESLIEEGRLMSDHVHMMIAIPPKYAVSQVVGYIKGKSAIHLARVYAERKRSFVGQHFWARGYFVSTVGRDEEVIREYIRNQEHEYARLKQLNPWRWRCVAAFRRPRISGAASATPLPLRAAHTLKPPALPGDNYYFIEAVLGAAGMDGLQSGTTIRVHMRNS